MHSRHLQCQNSQRRRQASMQCRQCYDRPVILLALRYHCLLDKKNARTILVKLFFPAKSAIPFQRHPSDLEDLLLQQTLEHQLHLILLSNHWLYEVIHWKSLFQLHRPHFRALFSAGLLTNCQGSWNGRERYQGSHLLHRPRIFYQAEDRLLDVWLSLKRELW